MSSEWRAEQDRCLRAIQQHQEANHSYMEEGIRLIELAHGAHNLFQKQDSIEKSRLLGFVVSNCVWKDGELTVQLRQPFDMLAKSVADYAGQKRERGGTASISENWLPDLGSNL